MLRLSVLELEALDDIRAIIGGIQDVYEMHPRAYVIAKGAACITVAVPKIDDHQGLSHHRCHLYSGLEVGDFCSMARVSLEDAPMQWVAAPIGGRDE